MNYAFLGYPRDQTTFLKLLTPRFHPPPKKNGRGVSNVSKSAFSLNVIVQHKLFLVLHTPVSVFKQNMSEIFETVLL